jgi:hypothetical protein
MDVGDVGLADQEDEARRRGGGDRGAQIADSGLEAIGDEAAAAAAAQHQLGLGADGEHAIDAQRSAEQRGAEAAHRGAEGADPRRGDSRDRRPQGGYRRLEIRAEAGDAAQVVRAVGHVEEDRIPAELARAALEGEAAGRLLDMREDEHQPLDAIARDGDLHERALGEAERLGGHGHRTTPCICDDGPGMRFLRSTRFPTCGSGRARLRWSAGGG